MYFFLWVTFKKIFQSFFIVGQSLNTWSDTKIVTISLFSSPTPFPWFRSFSHTKWPNMQGRGCFLFLKLFIFTYAIPSFINSIPLPPSSPSMSFRVNIFFSQLRYVLRQETFLKYPFPSRAMHPSLEPMASFLNSHSAVQ